MFFNFILLGYQIICFTVQWTIDKEAVVPQIKQISIFGRDDFLWVEFILHLVWINGEAH